MEFPRQYYLRNVDGYRGPSRAVPGLILRVTVKMDCQLCLVTTSSTIHISRKLKPKGVVVLADQRGNIIRMLSSAYSLASFSPFLHTNEAKF